VQQRLPHCYINLPAGDRERKRRSCPWRRPGRSPTRRFPWALWCLVTGASRCCRRFSRHLPNAQAERPAGSVFTNACLLTGEHVELFGDIPADIEVSVYGVSEKTYERVTPAAGIVCRVPPGSRPPAFERHQGPAEAMALRSNVEELRRSPGSAERTVDYFRFDPLLHLRFDGIRRGTRRSAGAPGPEEIAAIEQADEDRAVSLQKECDRLIVPGSERHSCGHLFHCGAGVTSFDVSSEGLFRLCSSLWQKDCVYDLRLGTLADAWSRFVRRCADDSGDREFLEKCGPSGW